MGRAFPYMLRRRRIPTDDPTQVGKLVTLQ